MSIGNAIAAVAIVGGLVYAGTHAAEDWILAVLVFALIYVLL